eukprot:SM000029S10507  [mRNA]  locus=s29:552049:552960:+ [translate_table: standard]
MQALDLLHRRIKAEMMSRQATPALRLLNELLQLDESNAEGEADWQRAVQAAMRSAFLREDALGLLLPGGIDLAQHFGPLEMPPAEEEPLLRIDFIREVDALLAEIEAAEAGSNDAESNANSSLDASAVALRLQRQERTQALERVRQIRRLAALLRW